MSAGAPCYGTNVHPAEDLRGILAMIDGPAAAVRAEAAPGGVLGLGLWLPRRAAEEILADAGAAAAIRARLAAQGLRIATANVFPAGGFHADRVKESVYRPDWGEPGRREYTVAAARALARILEPGTTCVASTLPGAWRRRNGGPGAGRELALGLADAAAFLADLAGATGVRIVLAPEPEPGCTLETAEEAAAFWRRDLLPALGADADRLLPHLGICADLCHLAVGGEDPAAALGRLRAAGVPVAKVQVSAALEIPDPAGSPGRVEALRRFDEPRWLHQCGGRTPLGTWRRAADLPELFADREAWLRCAPWRVHFHAPVHAAEVAGVPTTRDLVAPAIRAALAGAGEPPVLEVETYTWRAMPGFGGSDADLAREIAAELRFAADAAAPSRISGGADPGGRESPP